MPLTDPLLGEGNLWREQGVEGYRRLADVFHHVLSEQNSDALLDLIADALAEILPHDTLTIYEADAVESVLKPIFTRDEWAKEVLDGRLPIGKGITGWAARNRKPVLANKAHLDPRVEVIPGTPNEPEALISIPLVARGATKGVLNIYRQGEDVEFTNDEFELAKCFADAAALAIDNAHQRTALELQAQTDFLTGLYNHRYFQERLRAELNRAGRAHDSVTLLLLDIDDFNVVNDTYGHAIGDHVLSTLAEMVKSAVRISDVVCRVGGEEFAVIMPSCDAGDGLGLARRIIESVSKIDFDPVGEISLSIGVAQGPDHSLNPRELFSCADTAVKVAKSRGKSCAVLYEEDISGEDGRQQTGRDVRSVAHLKMLQSLAGKLNRLNDTRRIGATIADELRTLIDYHQCWVYVIEKDSLEPIAFRGLDGIDSSAPVGLSFKVGEGVVGSVAKSGEPMLIDNLILSEFAAPDPEVDERDESVVAVPLQFGQRVIGVVAVSKLGVEQFDFDDVRLLEVLAGHTSVALENARLYEAQQREGENAKALLEFADVISRVSSYHAIGQEAVRMAAKLLDSEQASLWMESERTADYECTAHVGYVGDPHVEFTIREKVESTKGDRLVGDLKSPFALPPGAQARFFEVPDGAPPRPVAIAPLPSGYGLKGWITVRQPSDDPTHFSEERLRILAGLSYQTAVAMQKAQLFREQKENAEIANALLEFSRELAIAEGMDEVLSLVVELAARILGSPKTSVWMQNPDSSALECHASWGFDGEEFDGLRAAPLDNELASLLMSEVEPLVIKAGTLSKIDRMAAERLGNLGIAVAPIRLDAGFACIIASAPAFGDYEFSERKMRLLAGIAHQAKVAVTNALSYENLERTFFTTVEALANALEAKDEYTSDHARWITDMCLHVGRELGMDGKDIKRLELGALFHDIGKIGIPSEILTKPGPLNDEEWEVIRLHPELGEKILAPIDRLEDVRPIVRHCHEHFDGTGYPDKKLGEEIPLESRIILVCDAFHAMTSDRTYRKALPVEEACRRLRENAGRQFDPAVVDAFLRVLEAGPVPAHAD